MLRCYTPIRKERNGLLTLICANVCKGRPFHSKRSAKRALTHGRFFTSTGQPSVNARPLGSVFVGRQLEMAELTAALNESMSGRGRMVMLAGEPGIGKTRTAQELASHAGRQGVQVLWGWCYEQEGAPPFWP